MVELVTTIEPETINRIVELEGEAFGNGGLNEWHLSPVIRHGKVYVIKDNGVIVGEVQYMLDWDKPDLAYMVGVTVASEVRGRGIATRLLAESIQNLFDDKIAAVELTVAADNIAAIKLYKEKLGFEETALRRNEYGPGQDRLVMVLTHNKFIEVV